MKVFFCLFPSRYCCVSCAIYLLIALSFGVWRQNLSGIYFQCPVHSIPLIREESEHLSNLWHFCSDVLHFWDRLYHATPSVLSCTEKTIPHTFLYASLWLHCYKKHYKPFQNNFKLYLEILLFKKYHCHSNFQNMSNLP